ncbi:PHD-zinc-finger like domain-containing protein [Lentinula edodes]|uniref:PHD-zinc-finger like domain-containing protein n=1 Tax=Lentinula edodes TaxID=5353 RepID=UPI001E8D6E8F|nr:PHD-zinc-finger like domain-containing protein [Lentinula edodes]KAH7867753.1 PHD-zinc-finger like domain-containing protein [Lentinula edodes]
MEFLKPEGTSSSADFDSLPYSRVRLAWYYRPRDVSDRPGAIYSEICDINQVRAKCFVVHRDRLKRPDRNSRLSSGRTLRNTLVERYEYVAAEKNLESVQCDRCKKYFHMHCVQPPLQAKPSRGYGWTCAPCSRRHEEEVDSRAASNAPAPRGRGRPRKDRTQAEKEENFPVKHFRLWPFRYFGQYTLVEDTLDPEDLIFPRAATRVGPKYQLTAFPDNGGPHLGPDEERGTDKTVEVLGAVNDFTPSEMEACLRSITNDGKTRSSVDFLTEVVRQFSDATLNGKSLSSVTPKTLNMPRIEKWKVQPTRRYTDKDWSREEIVAFAIAVHGALRAVRDEVVVRSIYEVVRFYGHWKNTKLGEENERIRTYGSMPTPIPSTQLSLGGLHRSQTIGLSDDESSIIVPPSKVPSCGACRTRDSKIWWKAPKGLQSNVLCDSCGVNYRKYADLNMRPTRDESTPAPVVPSGLGQGSSTRGRPSGSSSSSAEKREGTPVTASSIPSTPPPPSNVPQLRCCACSKNGPVGKVIKCKKCGFSVHAASVGITLSADKLDDWRCDLCENEEEQEASIYHDCLLCPRPRGPVQSRPGSYLQACKVTESHGWAHVLCSVFIPEINFTNTSTMRSVEGITGIPNRRWMAQCGICQQRGGAVVKCSDCSKEYHVSCAWNQGHTFGFEIQPVKGTRRETHVTTMFRGEPGCMNAIISCKEHDHSRRQIYEICETDDGGESALQVYCRAYKQVPQVSQTHALLRKARRLDQLITVRPESSGPVADFPSEDLQCVKCSTHFTPKFYQTESGWLCHASNHDMSGGIVNTLKLRSPTLQPESLSVSGSEVLVN